MGREVEIVSGQQAFHLLWKYPQKKGGGGKCKRNIGGRKEYKQQSECRSLIFGLFSVLTLKCVL